MKIQWSTHAYSPVKEKRFNTLYLYAHMAFLSSHVRKKPRNHKTQTYTVTKSDSWCVCVCVSRIICCSNLAMFSEDHSCHCIRCDVTMATFSPLRLFLVSASSHRRHTRSVLGQDGSDREEWGILWLWIVCIVSAKEDYVFGIAAGFWNINTLGWNKENRQ